MSETTQPEVLVEAALEQLLSWPGLARSPQLAKFLNYIVKAKLSGDEASIKAYAIASTTRSPALPDIPTTAEAGLPGYQIEAWNGIVAPNGVPADVVAKLELL